MEKKENDEETEEGVFIRFFFFHLRDLISMLSFLCFYFQWVQCDKCEGWQHQVCALFNIRRNEGQAEYTCPPCYIAANESGERKPLHKVLFWVQRICQGQCLVITLSSVLLKN